MQHRRSKPPGITYHPPAQLIADCLIANASSGVAFLVAAHIDRCPACGLVVATAEGGEGQPDLSPLTAPVLWGEPPSAPSSEEFGSLHLLPWVQLRNGVEGALAPYASGIGECVYALRVAANAEVGAANLRSAFMVLVTAGGLKVDNRLLTAGDLLCLDKSPQVVRGHAAKGASVVVVADEKPRRLGRRPPRRSTVQSVTRPETPGGATGASPLEGGEVASRFRVSMRRLIEGERGELVAVQKGHGAASQQYEALLPQLFQRAVDVHEAEAQGICEDVLRKRNAEGVALHKADAIEAIEQFQQ